MIYQVSVILVLFCPLQITFTRSAIEKWKDLSPPPATKTSDLNSTQTFTSGFVRIDTFNTLYEKWIRAQVVPIGVCFQKGVNGGSAKIVQVSMDSVSISRTIEMYNSSYCSERFSSESLTLAKEQVVEEFTHSIRHVSDIKTALTSEPATSDGLIIT